MLQFIPSALYILHVSNYVVKQQQSDRVRRLSKQDAVPLNLNMKGLLALHPKTTGHNVYCCTEPLAYFLARLSDIEPRLVCKACGKLGADVRPHFEPARMGPTEAALPRNEETNRQPRDCSDAEKRQLVTLVRDGISIRAIAAALGRRANFVRMMAQEMKLILRKKAKRPSDYSKGKGVAPSNQRGPTCVTIGQ